MGVGGGLSCNDWAGRVRKSATKRASWVRKRSKTIENIQKYSKTYAFCLKIYKKLVHLNDDCATPLRKWSMPERLDNFEFLVLSFELGGPTSLSPSPRLQRIQSYGGFLI